MIPQGALLSISARMIRGGCRCHYRLCRDDCSARCSDLLRGAVMFRNFASSPLAHNTAAKQMQLFCVRPVAEGNLLPAFGCCPHRPIPYVLTLRCQESRDQLRASLPSLHPLALFSTGLAQDRIRLHRVTWRARPLSEHVVDLDSLCHFSPSHPGLSFATSVTYRITYRTPSVCIRRWLTHAAS